MLSFLSSKPGVIILSSVVLWGLILSIADATDTPSRVKAHLRHEIARLRGDEVPKKHTIEVARGDAEPA